MSSKFGPFVDSEQISLVELLERLAAHQDVTPQRLARVRSAANTLARVVGRPLASIPAHPRWLNDSFRLLKQSGLAAKTVANTKSELRFAMRIAVGRQARSAMPKLSTEWAPQYVSLAGSPLQWQLCRLIRYLSGIGVHPNTVHDTHAGAFLKDLEGSHEIERPYYRWRAAIRAWNRAVETVPGWPARTLSLPPRRRREDSWTLPEERFDKSFRADVDAYFERLGRDNLRPEDGPRRALKPQTIRHRKHQLYKFASAAVLAGTPISSVTSLARLVEIPTFTDAAQYLFDRQDGRTTEALHGLVGALLAVAKYHARVDKEHLERLREIYRALDPCEEGFREKTRKRLEQFEDDRNIARLLHLPRHLLELARSPGTPRRQVAVLAQMAVAIELLLFAPLRAGNLAALNLERHIRRVVADGEERLIITVPREEVKNNRTNTNEIVGDSLALIYAPLALY